MQRGKWLQALFVATWLAGIFLATLPVQALTYWVDTTNGNDSWSGTASNLVSGTNGPFKSFVNFNYGGRLAPNGSGPPAGTTVFVRGLIDHTSDNIASSLDLSYAMGTSNNPIVFSNWPGYTCIISNSGPTQSTIALTDCSWVKIFGINSTNAYRTPSFQYDTNCEYAYSSSGGSNALGTLNIVTIYNNSQSNWIHGCTFGPVVPFDNPSGDGGSHGVTMGQFYATNDFTSYNIIESNTFFHSGHDVLSVYGPSNIIQYNWGHSAPWYSFTNVAWGSRDLEVGGTIGNYNLIQYNNWNYAGYVPDQGCHGVEMSDGAFEIFRYNYCLNDAACGIIVYGGKVGGTTSCSNYIYNNTLAFDGFDSTYTTSGSVTNESDPVWQNIMAFTSTRSNFIVNNLAYDNFTNTTAFFDGVNVDVARWANNLTNTDPLFANTNDTAGEFVLTPPDCSIPYNSPAVAAGTWLAYITSAPATNGTSFNVDNAGYFWGNTFSAGARTFFGDTIQLQGQMITAQITSISGNAITVNSPLTWTNGQGVALPYSLAAPDVGAFVYMPPPLTEPLNFRITGTGP